MFESGDVGNVLRAARSAIDSLWRMTELHDGARLGEVNRGKPEGTEAEIFKSLDKAARVLRFKPQPDVEVLGEPGMSVGG